MIQALYRKYRPQKFSEILGQDHIVNILENAIKAGRINHAYLFSGPRGTGKTSLARILAKDIGCHEYDLLEMDAASSRGIDEIRGLREAVYIMPLKSERKVYIIDEVHMLTKEAFNALLKTLEEPPSHAVFILATTEPEKLPDTITSRCQHFAFKKIPENVLKKSLKKTAQQEGCGIDEETAGLIAFFSDGSLRDGQVMLEQLLAIGDKNKDRQITGAEAREMLQAPSKELIRDFSLALIEKNSEAGLRLIQKITEKGIDVQLFLKFVLRNIRAILMVKISPKSEEKLKEIFGEDEIKFLVERGSKVSVKDLGFILTLLLDAYDKTNRAFLPQLPLELVLAKIHLREQDKER